MIIGRKLLSVFAAAALSVTAGSSFATTLDLTGGGTGSLNGGFFQAPSTLAGTAGTGVLKPFLRIRNNGTESGYNSDRPNGGPPGTDTQEFDEVAGIWTHSLQYQDLTGPAGLFEFLLDVNENVPSGDISLDSVRIFNVGADKDLAGLSFGDGTDPFGMSGNSITEIWNMDVGADGDSEVLLDYNLVGTGSGRADMSLFLSRSLFAGVALTDHIVFYSSFGNTDSSDAGFEEWALRECPPNSPTCSNPGGGGPNPIPLPAGLPLLLSALGIGGIIARRKRKAA